MKRQYNNEKYVRELNRIVPRHSHVENFEARIALQILEKHAMIAAIPDGERSL